MSSLSWSHRGMRLDVVGHDGSGDLPSNTCLYMLAIERLCTWLVHGITLSLLCSTHVDSTLEQCSIGRAGGVLILGFPISCENILNTLCQGYACPLDP